MRNAILGLFALLLAVSCVYASAPTGETVDANYVWELDTTISDAAGFDTIDGDDSIVIVSNFVPEVGYQYVLVTSALTEGSEAEFILNITCKDEDKDVLYVSSAVDTLNDDGGAVLLPFGETLFGNYFKLVLVDGGNDVGTNLLNTVKIYKRRCVQGDRVRWR